MLEDEGCGGTIHLACGDNVSFGGQHILPVTFGYDIKSPTMIVDK